MGVVIKKAGAITNRDANPSVLSNANIIKGTLVEAVGVMETATTDSVGSTYIFATVPSNARISKLELSCDAATAGAMDFGVYQNTNNGGAVVSAPFFASAVSLGSALVHSDITHEADAADAGSGYGLQDVEKPLWQALGLASDPGRSYDIVGTITTGMTAAGTVGLKVRYAA